MKYIIYFVLFFSSSFLYAGAAEKWEYEPKMKDLNIEVKAHKVDQFGDAVNDYEYNTKVDPKTVANKTKMGSVGIARLLKSNLYSALGNYALEQLLNAVDWVIDPDAQSIWRNKPNTPEYTTCFDGKYLFRAQNGIENICPDLAIEAFWKSVSDSSVQYKFKKWQTTPSEIIIDKKGLQILYTVTSTTSSGTVDNPNQTLVYKENPNYKPSSQEKEYLTPEALADYANHTHPDYTDPKRAPALEPKYSPEIAEKLWKPGNEWEYENSPTVQEVKKELEKSDPTPKDDSIKENEPDPETGQNSWSLPKACDWFPKACSYFDWMREEPEQDNEDTEVEVNDLEIPDIDTSILKAAGQCPADFSYAFPLPFGGTYTISYSYATVCYWFSKLYYIVISVAWIVAYKIVTGVGGTKQDG